MKPATSNLVCQALSHEKKSGLGELAEMWGFPLNISATAGASDFKFGAQLVFAKANDKSTRRKRVDMALG